MERDPQAHWLETETALHYARAAVRVGLWASEKVLLERHFSKDQRILELGCGGGRVALGLLRSGYREVVATDFSPIMVSLARAVLADHDESWEKLVEQQDATALTYPDASFDRAIFAFNGLMCLPSRAHRLAALRSIHRILKPDGLLLFTASDREKGANAAYWAKEARPADIIPGDRWHESDTSPVFIHSSTEQETREELSATGFKVIECPLSTEVAADGPLVRDFAGETRFYVARKS
jgi:ubiquinone/menaquinone biosynthesis C-methylase UbiE